MSGKPTIERVQVAAMLRSMREEAGITREQSAQALGCTTSKIGDLETGRSAPKVAELDRLLDLYRIAGAERAELLEFARASRRRKPRSKYATVVVPYTQRRAADLEAQSLASTFFSGELVPGILQTEGYAEATLRWANANSEAEVQRLLELRMGRKGTDPHRPGATALLVHPRRGRAADQRRRLGRDARADRAPRRDQPHSGERGDPDPATGGWDARPARGDGDLATLPPACLRYPPVRGAQR